MKGLDEYGQVIAQFIGIMVVLVVGVAVVVPIISKVVEDSGIDAGPFGLVLHLIPLVVAISAILYVVSRFAGSDEEYNPREQPIEAVWEPYPES